MKFFGRNPRLAGAVAMIVAFAGVIGVPSAVSAKPIDGQPLATITLVKNPSNGDVSAAATMNCVLSIGNPHKSTHVPTTVNVVGTWLCTGPAIMSSLSISMKLYRGVVQVGSGYNSVVFRNYMAANAASNCVNGQYYGTATGSFVSPPGYTPPSGTIGVYSPVVSISGC